MKVDSLTITTPDAAALKREGAAALFRADFVQITTPEELTFAKDEMNALAARLKELEAERKKITTPLDAAKKAVMDLFRPAVEDYKRAVSTIKGGIAAYLEEMEKQEAQARIEAEKKAAEEREALRREAEASDSPEVAAACLEAAELVSAQPEVVAPGKVSGMSAAKKWRGRVTDISAFMRFAAEHPEYQACFEIKSGKLDAIAASTGGSLAVPGVSFYQETIISSRGSSRKAA